MRDKWSQRYVTRCLVEGGEDEQNQGGGMSWGANQKCQQGVVEKKQGEKRRGEVDVREAGDERRFWVGRGFGVCSTIVRRRDECVVVKAKVVVG